MISNISAYSPSFSGNVKFCKVSNNGAGSSETEMNKVSSAEDVVNNLTEIPKEYGKSLAGFLNGTKNYIAKKTPSSASLTLHIKPVSCSDPECEGYAIVAKDNNRDGESVGEPLYIPNGLFGKDNNVIASLRKKFEDFQDCVITNTKSAQGSGINPDTEVYCEIIRI